MDDVSCGQAKSRGDACLPRGASPECAADGQQLRSRRPVNGAVDASTSKERLVGGVDDGVNVQARDVSLDQIDPFNSIDGST